MSTMQSILNKKFEWINQDLVNKIIKNDVQAQNRRSASFYLSNMCAEGENFVSHLIKLHVVFEDHKKSYVIKIINMDSRFAQFVDLNELFDKEIFMYERILPELADIWKNVGTDIEFGPKCLLVLKDVKAIVLEDLFENKFRTRKKQSGLDRKEINCVIENLTKFHAASLLYLEKQPKQSDIFYHGIFSSRYNNEWRQKMYDTLFNEGLLKVVSSMPDLVEETEKLKKWSPNILERIGNLLKYKDGGFNVLNHGDLWTCNILFKAESEDKLDMRMLDFQFSCISHPIQDLFYFMMHTLNETDRADLFELILEEYFILLIKNIKVLGYQGYVPNKKSFLMETAENSSIATFYLIFHVMVMLLDDGIKLDMVLALDTNSEQGDIYRNEVLYGNTKYKIAVNIFLKFLNHKQLLK